MAFDSRNGKPKAFHKYLNYAARKKNYQDKPPQA
jgi:hypothetical protein